MSSTTTYFAQIKAEKKLHFDIPFSTGATSELTLRKNNNKVDVYYSISEGIIMVNTLYADYTQIKFDNEKPIKVKYTISSDHSMKTIFLGSAKLIEKKLKSAKKFIIEVTFFKKVHIKLFLMLKI